MGSGAKDIGGEIQVTDLDYALFLKDRGIWLTLTHLNRRYKRP
jgi:hypothetical protein